MKSLAIVSTNIDIKIKIVAMLSLHTCSHLSMKKELYNMEMGYNSIDYAKEPPRIVIVPQLRNRNLWRYCLCQKLQNLIRV